MDVIEEVVLFYLDRPVLLVVAVLVTMWIGWGVNGMLDEFE